MVQEKGNPVRELRDRKHAAIEANQRDFMARLSQASFQALNIMMDCRGRMHEVIDANPSKRCDVEVFRSDSRMESISEESVREAAELLRHPAMGYPVVAQTLVTDEATWYLIIMFHRGS